MTNVDNGKINMGYSKLIMYSVLSYIIYKVKVFYTIINIIITTNNITLFNYYNNMYLL